MNRQEFLDFGEAAGRLGVSRRQAQRMLGDAAPGLVRTEKTTGGRPRQLVHVSAHPKLLAEFCLQDRGIPSVGRVSDPAPMLAPDDLAVAMLRARAVEEYRAILHAGSEARAAAVTCADWAAAPRREIVRLDERMPGGRKGRTEQVVQVGPFCARTLRRWHSLYKDNLNIAVLAPERKDRAGRPRYAGDGDTAPEKRIPDQLLDMIQALACSTARADLRKAIAKTREMWPGDWPAVSYQTIRSRIRERDPAKFCDALGKSGISRFRMEHSPDCERDYSNLRYNQVWQLDDVTLDFYGHSSDLRKLLRPFAYAIIRVSTREWICAVTCETPITQDQVRSLLGLAMADPAGGVPEEITFERGSVACDDYLRALLETLGIKVSRTSMDGGTVAPGMLADRAKGHFQGKAVCESNIKRAFHDTNWDRMAQVGTEERHTAPARNDTLIRYASACVRAGLPPILPTAGEWQAMVFAGLEKANHTPHGGLPELVDVGRVSDSAQTSIENLVRHMTPAEKAAQLKSETVRVMDERLLPLFFERGLLIPVTRNGIRVQNGSYGRFDEELQKLAGTSVMVFAQALIPDVVYIKEIGRCVDLYSKPAYGAGEDDIQKKRGIERGKRNQFEALLARAMAAGRQINADAVKFTSNPVPDRVREMIAPAALLERADAIVVAREVHGDRRAAQNARFNMDAVAGRGLLARAEGLREEVLVLHIGRDEEQPDKFTV